MNSQQTPQPDPAPAEPDCFDHIAGGNCPNCSQPDQSQEACKRCGGECMVSPTDVCPECFGTGCQPDPAPQPQRSVLEEIAEEFERRAKEEADKYSETGIAGLTGAARGFDTAAALVRRKVASLPAETGPYSAAEARDMREGYLESRADAWEERAEKAQQQVDELRRERDEGIESLRSVLEEIAEGFEERGDDHAKRNCEERRAFRHASQVLRQKAASLPAEKKGK